MSERESTPLICAKCGGPATRLRRGQCNPCYKAWHKEASSNGVYQSNRVDIQPIQEHLAALIALDLTPQMIAKQAGIDPRRVTQIISGIGERGTPRAYTARHIADAILSLPVAGAGITKALGTIRRLQALVTIGYPLFELAHRLRADEAELERIVLRRPTVVDVELADNVKALYATLHVIAGPNDDARKWGRRMHWASTFAWDDLAALDDPNAKPEGVPPKIGGWAPIPADFPDVVADYRARGHSDAEIAELLGLTRDALKKRYKKFGIDSRTAVAS